MRKPTAKQLSYFNALVTKVAASRGCAERDVLESLGAYEDSPWGGRLRTEAITFGNVSRWIDTLRSTS